MADISLKNTFLGAACLEVCNSGPQSPILTKSSEEVEMIHMEILLDLGAPWTQGGCFQPGVVHKLVPF